MIKYLTLLLLIHPILLFEIKIPNISKRQVSLLQNNEIALSFGTINIFPKQDIEQQLVKNQIQNIEGQRESTMLIQNKKLKQILRQIEISKPSRTNEIEDSRMIGKIKIRQLINRGTVAKVIEEVISKNAQKIENQKLNDVQFENRQQHSSSSILRSTTTPLPYHSLQQPYSQLLSSSHPQHSSFSSSNQYPPNNRPHSRLLQQSFPPPTPSTPIRLINLTSFLSTIPGYTIQPLPTPKSPSQAFTQLFKTFNQSISAKLSSQNIAFTPFPPFPKDNSSQIIENNRSMVSYAPPVSNRTAQQEDTSGLPDVIPIRPLVLPADYQITSSLPITNMNPAQIITAPAATPTPPPTSSLNITPTQIPSNFLDQPQPRIPPQSSILNAFRSLQTIPYPHYIIQQADPSLDPNLIGLILQLRDSKPSDFLPSTNITILYSQFSFIPSTNTTNYNLIFKNTAQYIITAIQLPFKILNYNVLTPQQFNPLCVEWARDGNCVRCGEGYYMAVYGVCIGVNVRCEDYEKVTGFCMGCYEKYQLVQGDCVMGNSSNASTLPNTNSNTNSTVITSNTNINLTIQGCTRQQNNICEQCQQRYYNNNGVCKVVSRLCVTWDDKTGRCMSCYQGYRLNDGVCRIG